MTYDQKVELYRAGSYLMASPPVPHQGWSVSVWVAYIDAHGVWCDKPTSAQ